MRFQKQAPEIDYVLQHMHGEDVSDGLARNWQSVFQVGDNVHALRPGPVDPDAPLELLDPSTADVQRHSGLLALELEEVPHGEYAADVCRHPADSPARDGVAHLAVKMSHTSQDPDGEPRVLDKAMRLERFGEDLQQRRVQLVAHLSPHSCVRWAPLLQWDHS